MIPEWISGLSSLGPLAGTVIVVAMFLRDNRRRDVALKSIADGCHEVQRDAIAAINRNTETIGAVTMVLTRLNGGKR